VIGLHRFGLSAPSAEVMKEFGLDAQHVIAAARSLL
jgi:transketolase